MPTHLACVCLCGNFLIKQWREDNKIEKDKKQTMPVGVGISLANTNNNNKRDAKGLSSCYKKNMNEVENKYFSLSE